MRTLTEDRRQAIVGAAAQVFQEMGYERASMDAVAKRVGGSKATLYNYFSSKEELFETVVRAFSTRFLSEAADELTKSDAKVKSLEENLTRFGERMLSVITNDSMALQIYRIVVGESGHSDVGTLFHESGPRQSVERLSALMAEAMQKGELAQCDPALRANQFMALVKAEVDVLLLQREQPHFTLPQVREMVKYAVSLFLLGAGPNSAKINK